MHAFFAGLLTYHTPLLLKACIPRSEKMETFSFAPDGVWICTLFHLSFLCITDVFKSFLSINSFHKTMELKGEAQAEVVVAVGRRVVVPIRHTTVPGVVVPAAPTIHAVIAIYGYNPLILDNLHRKLNVSALDTKACRHKALSAYFFSSIAFSTKSLWSTAIFLLKRFLLL